MVPILTRCGGGGIKAELICADPYDIAGIGETWGPLYTGLNSVCSSSAYLSEQFINHFNVATNDKTML